MSTPDPTPTPLPAAPDWKALCADLLAQCDAGEMAPVEALEDIRAALATPPAPPPEPRGCPTPGACSCPTAPIVPPELIRALQVAEEALADIGDAEREPGDDLAWAERRAAQDLPRVRRALRIWRDHATPPAATREAGPLPQAGAVSERLSGVAVDGVPCDFIRTLLRPAYEPGDGSADGAQLVSQAWWHPIMGCDSLQIVVDNARAVLARWGGAAVPVPSAGFFPVEYADGDRIRILMEPSEETGRACWVVRNSRHVNPFHEFPTPEAAYAAHAHRAAAAGEVQP